MSQQSSWAAVVVADEHDHVEGSTISPVHAEKWSLWGPEILVLLNINVRHASKGPTEAKRQHGWAPFMQWASFFHS
jgi:hypothetical protein